MNTREPLAIRGAIVAAVVALLQVAIAFGLPITPDQFAVISVAINTIATAVVVAWSRGAVTPVADPHNDQGQPLESIEDVY